MVDELSEQRVLALEWIEGEPILAPAARTALENGPVQATTKALLGAFVEQYFVEGFFHTDPDSNLKVLEDGSVILRRRHGGRVRSPHPRQSA